MKKYSLIILTICVAFLFGCSSSKKYVNYLENHTEVIPMADSLQFNSLDEEFYSNKLFFVGEVHEVESSPRIDFALFTQLNQKIGINIYLAEMDFAQGYYLQKYFEGSDELGLQEILENWAVYIGRISEQHRNKWRKMRTYYSSLPDSVRFELIGVDKISDFELVRKLLTEKLPSQYRKSIPADNKELIAWSDGKLNEILQSRELQLEPDKLDLLKNIQFNLSNYLKIKSRDKFMHENFKRYYVQKQLDDSNIYGGFGFSHTLQAYKYTLAGRIKNDSTMNYSNKMVSMNALYVDSKLTVQSRSLPKFMQDKGGDFTRFNYSQDNRLFMYIQGIADYKKVTKPNSISLIKLDADGSPYLNSTRGTKLKKLITIWDGYDIIEGTSTTDYAQYVFFVRNADWIQPD